MSKKLSILALFEKLEEQQKIERDAKSNIKLLQKQLYTAIPENSTKAGVFRKTWTQPSISYKNVITDLRPLIPKTKWEQIDTIIESNTSLSLRNKLSLEATE